MGRCNKMADASRSRLVGSAGSWGNAAGGSCWRSRRIIHGDYFCWPWREPKCNILILWCRYKYNELTYVNTTFAVSSMVHLSIEGKTKQNKQCISVADAIWLYVADAELDLNISKPKKIGVSYICVWPKFFKYFTCITGTIYFVTLDVAEFYSMILWFKSIFSGRGKCQNREFSSSS